MFNEIVFIASMLATTPDFTADARHPDVRLGDAREFGLTPANAREAWLTARRHGAFHDEYIRERYPFAVYMNWRAEQAYAERVYDCLDNVLNGPGRSRESRLEELDRLRVMLGDANYHARKLPMPCPGHLFVD
jgi:hypothetical protein